MTREEIIKLEIKNKYGSVQRFADAIGMSESSVRNIFVRGFDSLNVEAAIKVCKALNLDIEHLMNGVFCIRPNAQMENAVRESYGLTDFERMLVNAYRQAESADKAIIENIVGRYVSDK